MEEDAAFAKRVQESRNSARAVVEELRSAGYDILTLADLRHSRSSWQGAIPILARFLPLQNDPEIKEEIIRNLSVPWVQGDLVAQMIDEFRKAPKGSSLAWAIGNALSIVETKKFEEEIIELCKNKEYGTARQMIVLGLGRFDDPRAENAALTALQDEQVKLHAILALSRMRSTKALPYLGALLTDQRAVVRKEARKAIKKIEKTGDR